jgi:hypothetical protein
VAGFFMVIAMQSEEILFPLDGEVHWGPSRINNIQIHTNGHLLTILPDGTIERGPAFTTTDAASLEFWRLVSERFKFKSR